MDEVEDAVLIVWMCGGRSSFLGYADFVDSYVVLELKLVYGCLGYATWLPTSRGRKERRRRKGREWLAHDKLQAAC